VSWVPLIVWGAALLFGAVILTFCGYEVHWKAGRLRADLERLQALEAPTRQLQADLTAAAQRLAAARSRLGAGR
jgi:hypothetical protein